jgi:hypothetical protein
MVCKGNCYIVNERGFTRDAIAANMVTSKQSGQESIEKVNGRTIYEKALTSIAMCKFALKYCNG